MIYATTELALVDFDGLISTADPLRTALQVHQHGLFAELASVSHGTGDRAILWSNNVRSYAARNIVCEEHNLLESEVFLLKP